MYRCPTKCMNRCFNEIFFKVLKISSENVVCSLKIKFRLALGFRSLHELSWHKNRLNRTFITTVSSYTIYSLVRTEYTSRIVVLNTTVTP